MIIFSPKHRFLIEGKLLHNIVLASAIDQHESALCIHRYTYNLFIIYLILTTLSGRKLKHGEVNY